MPRKSNPEKDILISPASGTAARPRRAPPVARTPHAAAAPEPAVTPVRKSETPRADAVAVERELSHEEIARLAYSLWEARGCQGGNPEEDWLRAEQQLRERAVVTNV